MIITWLSSKIIKMRFKKITLINSCFFLQIGFAQISDKWTPALFDTIITARFNNEKNSLSNVNSLYPLLTKLYKIKHFSNEKAVIVHIGDSHIQADMMTSTIRISFQNYFGNAGRGLLFPFQVAKSNAPTDIISSSKNTWKSSRITRADTTVTCGIAGFGLETTVANSEINLELRTINGTKDSFDKITLFFKSKATDLQIESSTNENDYFCFEKPLDFFTKQFKQSTSGFKITFPTSETVKFFGVSVEKDSVGGVIYHSIGANGAKFSDYNKTNLFWKQLPNLKADCYIISLGTNEAQDQNLTEENFLVQVKTMVEKLRIASPNAAIILSTPPVSYYKKLRPNSSLVTITNAIIEYCNQNNVVCWDLFNASLGSDGAKAWKNNQLLNTDLVHFTKKGYVLQADLFVAAFKKTWEEFLLKK